MACLALRRLFAPFTRWSLAALLFWAAALPVRAIQPQRATQVADPWLRVLVWQAASGRIRPALAAGTLQMRDARGRLLHTFDDQAILQVDAAGGWLSVRQVQQPQSDRWQARELWFEATATEAEAESDPGIWLNQHRYRGRLQLRAEAGGLQVVNHLPLETYLPSVVGSEMPPSWPLEALQAQAVAARTYALRARKPAAPFDLQATTASQVYKGVESETASTRSAVQGTRGLVLTYNNALIEAVFHSSSSAGSTENSGDLWSKQLPYLVSVPDFDEQSPVHEWRQPLDQALLRRAFPELGGAFGIDVISTTPTGRVRQARVVGPSGQLALSGAQLRSRLGLKSTWVRFELAATGGSDLLIARPDGFPALLPPPPLPAFTLPKPVRPRGEVVQLVAVGRGYGHGVGMSQWGAMALAQKGEPFEAILKHYYRGVTVRAYNDLARASEPARPAKPLAVAR
jgi:stage II sporulation protein D